MFKSVNVFNLKPRMCRRKREQDAQTPVTISCPTLERHTEWECTISAVSTLPIHTP